MASLINSMTIIGKDGEETWIGSKNLVWAAALVHGGSKQNNELMRLSHVTQLSRTISSRVRKFIGIHERVILV